VDSAPYDDGVFSGGTLDRPALQRGLDGVMEVQRDPAVRVVGPKGTGSGQSGSRIDRTCMTPRTLWYSRSFRPQIVRAEIEARSMLRR
jgi:hypothetical protein